MIGYFSKNYNIEERQGSDFATFLLTFYTVKPETKEYLNIFQRIFAFTEKRIDLVEDMLKFVVESQGIIVIHKAINLSFTDFLQTANASTSF